MIVSETGTIMNFTTYLKNAIAKNGLNPYVFGSLTQNATERLNNLSMFSSASAQDIADIDLKALLAAVEAADVDVEGATGDQKALNDILKAFLEIKDVQQAADADGDGKLTDAEAKEFLAKIMGNDGDTATLTMADIDKAIENLGIDLNEIANEAAEELLDEEKIDETNNNPAASGASGGGGVSGAGSSSGASKSSATKEKTTAETVAEIEKQIEDKNAEIDEVEANAEAQIKEQEDAKEKAMKDAGVSDEEYKKYQEEEQKLEKSISEKDKEISEHNDKISNNEATISSNKNYIGSLEQQISANKSALSGISDDAKNAADQKQSLQSKIDNLSQEKEAKESENKKLEEENKKEKEAVTKAEQEKKNYETKKQELLSKTLTSSEGFAKGVPSADAAKIKENIAQYDTKITEIRSEKEQKVASIKSEIQDLNVKLKDAKESEERNKFLRDNSPNDGQSVIDLAKSFEGKSQAEMREIMRNAGYQFDDGAWCADFVSYIASQTIGEDNLADWYKNCNRAYCPDIMNNAKANGAFIGADQAQMGDAVLFDWDGDGTADHIGYVISINDDGTANTIEGNTGGNVSGSQVASKQRNSGNILGYVRLT